MLGAAGPWPGPVGEVSVPPWERPLLNLIVQVFSVSPMTTQFLLELFFSVACLRAHERVVLFLYTDFEDLFDDDDIQ